MKSGFFSEMSGYGDVRFSEIVVVSPEARDALYSQATDLLTRAAARRSDTSIDPRFRNDLRLLLDALGNIDPCAAVELRVPNRDLLRTIRGIQGQLPPDPESTRRSARTQLVAKTCTSVIAQLSGFADAESKG